MNFTIFCFIFPYKIEPKTDFGQSVLYYCTAAVYFKSSNSQLDCQFYSFSRRLKKTHRYIAFLSATGQTFLKSIDEDVLTFIWKLYFYFIFIYLYILSLQITPLSNVQKNKLVKYYLSCLSIQESNVNFNAYPNKIYTVIKYALWLWVFTAFGCKPSTCDLAYMAYGRC